MSSAFVQRVTNVSNGNTVAITATTGNLLVAYTQTSTGGGNPTFTVSDGTNTYNSLIAASNPAGATFFYGAVYAKNISGGSKTLTFTFNGGTPGNCVINVLEYSGLDTANPLIAAAAANVQAGPGTGTDAVTSANVNFTAQPAVLIGYSVDEPNNTTPAAGTGFTSRGTGAGYRFEDKRITAYGNAAATFKLNASGTDTTVTFAVGFAEPPKFVLVQSANAQSFSGGVSSLQATFTKAVTAGNTILAYVGTAGSPATTFTVSDSVNSGNYATDVTNAGTGNCAAGIYRFSATNAGTPTVTASVVGGGTIAMGLVIEEWTGITPSSPLDQSISNFNSGANTSPTSANTGNYFEAGELMVANGMSAAAVTWSAGAGFTADANSPGGHQLVEYQILASTTGTAATYSLSAQTFWQVLAATYKPAQPNLGAQTINAQTGGLSAAALSYGLTNQSSTSSVGTITSEVDITLGSLSATFVEGSLLNQINLTGQTASFSEGTITTAISGNVILAISGQSLSFAQGAPNLVISYLLDQDTITLVGQTAMFAMGLLQPNLVLPLTVQTLASTEGTITSAPSYTLGALTVTSLEGSITSSLGNNTNQSLIGQNITSSQGAMQFLPGATFPLNTLSFTEGTITFSATGDFTVSLTGLTINSSEGTITFTGSAPGFLTMPNVVGIGWLHASHILEKAGLFQTQPPLRVLSKVYPTYTVLGQEPPAGSLVPLNSAVQLTVSIDAPLLGASFDVLPLF